MATHDELRDIALTDLITLAGHVAIAAIPYVSGKLPAHEDTVLVVRLDPFAIGLCDGAEVLARLQATALAPDLLDEFGKACGAFVVEAVKLLSPEAREKVGAAVSTRAAGFRLTIELARSVRLALEFVGRELHLAEARASLI